MHTKTNTKIYRIVLYSFTNLFNKEQEIIPTKSDESQYPLNSEEETEDKRKKTCA